MAPMKMVQRGKSPGRGAEKGKEGERREGMEG